MLQAILGEMLPISNQIIDSYKGKEDMSKELSSDEVLALNADLLKYHDANAHLNEVNGSIAYT